MKKALVKLTTITLVLVILFGSAISVSAAGVSAEQSAFSYEELEDYAHSIVDSYLGINCLLEEGKSFYLTQGIPIENDEDPYNHVFFVFSNNSSVGYLTATYVDENYYSSFVPGGIAEVDDAYLSGVAITLSTIANSCYLMLGQDVVLLCGSSDEIPTVNTAPSSRIVNNQQRQQLSLKPVDTANTSTRGSTIPPKVVLLNVQRVWNKTVNGKGICWCAAIASIGAYKTNATVNVQTAAQSLYDWLDANYTADILKPTPTGNHNYHIAAFNKYGLNYARYYLGLTFDEVMACVELNNPIYAIIEGSGVLWDDDDICHSVVICGAGYDAEANYYYLLMDPNVHGSYVTVLVTNTSSRDFTYASNSGTYTFWSRRYQ